MATELLTRYVVKDAAIQGGEPIIAGTRTPVRAIVEIWHQGTLPELIGVVQQRLLTHDSHSTTPQHSSATARQTVTHV